MVLARTILSRRPRRLLLIAVAIVVVGMFAAAPRLVGIPPVRRAALALANRALAPSRVELATIHLSWLGPTRMTGLVLRDRRGKAVVAAPRATLDRDLRQLLFDRPRYGTLTLLGAKVDIERRADGGIDLAEALDPILAPDPEQPSDPRTAFTLKVVGGTLRLRSPELAEPLTADRMDLTLAAPAAPAKLSWTIALANPSSPDGEGLDIGGHYDHRAAAGATPELALSLSGRRWPVAASGAGITARGRFQGRVELRQDAARRALTGDAQLLGLEAAGPALAGDRLRLDRVGGAWDVAEAAGAWTVRRLDLSSPVGSVKAEGTLLAAPGATARIEGLLDLAALARQLPHALRLRAGLALERGRAQLRADLRAEGAGQALDVEARVSDLVARDASRTIALGDPATLSAHLTRQAGRIVVERVSGRAAWFDLSGSGDLDRGVSLAGTLDLGGLRAQLRDLIDFGGIGLAGRAQLSASYRRAGATYTGTLSADVRDLSLARPAAAPLRRDRLQLVCAAEGPAGAAGLPGGWQAVRLDLKAGDLATLDEALAAWTGGTPRGMAGPVVARVSARRDPDGLLHVDSQLATADLSIAAEGQGRRPQGPTSLVARGTYRAEADRIDLAELMLKCRYGSLTASGSLAEPAGRRLADLSGTAVPDWAVVNALVASAVEPGARLQGAVRPFRVRGPLSGGSTAEVLRGLDAELGLDLSGAQAFGLRIGPAPIVARCGGGRVAIEPIATTLNGGRVDLKPELLLDDPRGVILRLAPGAAITDAEIDDEASRRVLAYVAPILHEATQVRGHLSAAFDRAEFPIAGAEGDVAAEGRVTFREVTYGPGPLAQQLLGLVGRGATPSLRLDRTVSVAVADGRVKQSGLAIDVGPQVQIALDGSVGFDGTLALRAGVPITAAMLGDQQLLGQVVDGTRVGVPIGGTLSRPGIDQRALQVALREAGRAMLRRGAEAGAAGLLRRLAPQEASGGAASPGRAPSRRPGGSSLPEEALRLLRP